MIRELGRVEAPLEHMKVQFDPLRRDLIVGSLEHQLARRRRDLDRLESDVRGDAVALADCWSSYRRIAGAAAPVFAESLAFLEGAVSRETGLDDGLCTIADALLHDLSRRSGITWNGFTILAGHEFFGALAQVIRLRFGEVSVWNLPVAAHEFGHHAASAITEQNGGATRHPVEALLERERRRGPQYWAYGHELFADVFATWTLGPAYACTCLVARFDPLGAYANGPRHPAAARRAHVILGTLHQLSERAMGGALDEICAWLDEAWRRTLAGANQPERLGDGVAPGEPLGTAELDAWVTDVRELLVDHVYDRAAFEEERWSRALQLSSQLTVAHRERRAMQARPAPDDTIAVALNAGWHAAAAHGTAPFGDAVKALCEEIAGSNGQPGHVDA